MTKLINNQAARAEVLNVIATMNTKKTTAKKIIKTNATRSPMLARGEKAIFVAGSQIKIIFSPAGARDNSSVDRVLYYGFQGVLVNEDTDIETFNALHAA